MATVKVDVIETNIPELKDKIGAVYFKDDVIAFPASTPLKVSNIKLAAATNITTLDSDKYFTTARIDFGDELYFSFKSPTDPFLQHIKHIRLAKNSPFEVTEHISALAIVGGVFLVLLVVSGLNGGNSNNSQSASSSSKKILLMHEQAKICKAYIGALFAKPTSIIEDYKSHDNMVYVRYKRRSDNSTWSFVCDLSDSTISWQGWQKDINQWGRWRDEDEVPYYYDPTKNTVWFKLARTDKIISVQL